MQPNEMFKRVQRSDVQAYRKLFERYWKPMYSRAYALLNSRTSAEDVVQEVWLDLWKRRSQIQTDNIEAFLFRAVRNRVFLVYRQAGQQQQLIQQLHQKLQKLTDPEAMEVLEKEDSSKKLIENALECLPPQCKKVFELKRLRGLTQQEIATQLNISVKTVENHMTKALKILRKQ